MLTRKSWDINWGVKPSYDISRYDQNWNATITTTSPPPQLTPQDKRKMTASCSLQISAFVSFDPCFIHKLRCAHKTPVSRQKDLGIKANKTEIEPESPEIKAQPQCGNQLLAKTLPVDTQQTHPVSGLLPLGSQYSPHTGLLPSLYHLPHFSGQSLNPLQVTQATDG